MISEEIVDETDQYQDNHTKIEVSRTNPFIGSVMTG